MNHTTNTPDCPTPQAAPARANGRDAASASPLDRALLERVARSLAPSFPLRDAVAIHPLLGLADRPYERAAELVETTLGADVLPSARTLLELHDDGAFDAEDLRWAIARSRSLGDPDDVLGRLRAAAARADTATLPVVRTLADALDARENTALDALADDVVVNWLASRHDLGVSAWAQPVTATATFEDFVRWASEDRALDQPRGRGVRRFLRELPTSLDAALPALVAEVRLGGVDPEAYVRRLSRGILGWLGVLRAETFAAAREQVDGVVAVLVARLALDVALTRRAPAEGGEVAASLRRSPIDGARDARLLALRAAERAVRRRFERSLGEPPRTAAGPAAHVVFCIDVRSEPARRALEDAMPRATTAGYAGFFGVSVTAEGGGPVPGGARCPALVAPRHRVKVGGRSIVGRFGSALTAASQRLRRSLLGGMGYAELGVALSSLPLVFGRTGESACDVEHAADLEVDSVPLDARVDVVATMLRMAGPPGPAPRLLVLAGHDAVSRNNPLHAGLTCGACGGHGGALNARIVAAFCADPAVREKLTQRGCPLDPGTLVVAAVHDTTTDTFRVLDRARIPSSHEADVRALEGAFARTSTTLRAARLADAGVAVDGVGPDAARRALDDRARDWAEPRPEWALAGNALFVAARRTRTRHVDLAGRAFLHEYDETRDEDGALLRFVLAAPMVVAAHINGAYGLSVTAPEVFGSGPKNVHNVSGGVGVVRGNGGDLRMGLARESVFAGEQAAHAPLRLSVYVEASTERLTAALDDLPEVRALLDHEFVHLAALSPTGGAVVSYRPGVGF